MKAITSSWTGSFVLAHERDELGDSALVLVGFPPHGAAALVDQPDDEPRVQERELAQAVRENVEAVLGLREDLGGPA